VECVDALVGERCSKARKKHKNAMQRRVQRRRSAAHLLHPNVGVGTQARLADYRKAGLLVIALLRHPGCHGRFAGRPSLVGQLPSSKAPPATRVCCYKILLIHYQSAVVLLGLLAMQGCWWRKVEQQALAAPVCCAAMCWCWWTTRCALNE